MTTACSGRGDLESRAWRSIFRDGLWDIALGTPLLAVGLSATLDLARASTYLLYALAIATVVWAVLSLVAALWEFPRLGIHAVIIGASFFAIESFGRGWPTLTGSVIVLAIGVGYPVRFLRLYPKSAPEAALANS